MMTICIELFERNQSLPFQDIFYIHIQRITQLCYLNGHLKSDKCKMLFMLLVEPYMLNQPLGFFHYNSNKAAMKVSYGKGMTLSFKQ